MSQYRHSRTSHRHRRQDEETSYWLSYSDMMAGLLLTFVLIISLTMLHSRIQYDEKEAQLTVAASELDEEKATVSAQQATLDEQSATLAAQQAQMEEQASKLAAQQTQLDEQSASLKEKEDALTRQNELLGQMQDLLDDQQAQLDEIIGVRSELIEDLKREFENSNLAVAVDEQTGAITFDSSILFSYNKADLTDSGKEFLDEFLPKYCRILLSSRYRDYVSEILIEGHTDSSGGYLYNLKLSQDRAYAVAEYALADDAGILSDTQLERLRAVTSTVGRSSSDLILDENGEEDEEASRRVVFLFRLKDEEMIQEMMEILDRQNES